MSEDRITTQLQEVGRAPIIGESLATLTTVCANVGIEPDRALVSGVIRIRSVAPGEPSDVRRALNIAITTLDAIERGGDPRDLARKGLTEVGSLLGDETEVPHV